MTPEERGTTIDEFLKHLQDSFWKPTDAINKPVRDLSPDEARSIVVWLLAWGKFTLRNRDELFRVNNAGVTVLAPPTTKINLYPSVIEGVRFSYVTYIDTKGTLKTTDQSVGNRDMRHVVFLWKLARMLRIEYDVNTIYHIGFIFDASRNDSHGQGRALDFTGVSGNDFTITVPANWKAQPITLLKDWHGTPAGTKLADWPAAPFTDTYYRLDPSKNPNLNPALQPELSRQIFEAVYQLAAEEGTDTSDLNNSPTSIGPESAFILHPDYPHSEPGTPHGREAHWQHMHMQVGPTGPEVGK